MGQVLTKCDTREPSVNGFGMCSDIIGSNIELYIKVEVNPTFLDTLDGNLDL